MADKHIEERTNNLSYAEMMVLGSFETLDEFRDFQGLNPTFVVEHHQDIYNRITNHVLVEQTLPSRRTYEWWDNEWEFPDSGYGFWLGEYQRLRMVHAQYQAWERWKKDVQDDPEAAGVNVVNAIQNIGYHNVSVAHPLDSTIRQRFEAYMERQQRQAENGREYIGIRTGFLLIDETRLGWQPGEMIGILARPTVGKSWTLMRAGVIAWLTGSKVLFVSPEMSNQEVEGRVDALLAGFNGLPISQQALATGEPGHDESYRKLVELVERRSKGQERWHTIDEGLTLTELESQINFYRPDLVLIDGITLMKPESREQGTVEFLSRYSNGIKRLATAYDCAIMVTNQVINKRRGSRKDTDVAQGRGDDWLMPSLNDSYYSDAFVQACSTVITMAPDRETKYLRWYSFRKTRNRDLPEVSRMAFIWDVDSGRIIDVANLGTDYKRLFEEMNAYGIYP